MMQKTGIRRLKKPILPMMVVLAVLFCFTFFSCTKPAPFPTVPLTPLQVWINQDTTLNFFHDLILQSNNVTVLGNNPVTLLVATDSGFLANGYTLAYIDSMPAYLASALVRYSVLTTNQISLTPVVNLPYTTLLGLPVYLTRDSLSNNVYFNGVRAILDTAKTGLAVVYRLQAPLQTPYDSLDHLLAADSNYSLLAEAFLQTGLYDSLTIGSYAGGTYAGPYTLLAPNNTAFINAGYPDIPSIDSSNLAVLANLLRYQLVNGLYFANNLSGVSSLSSLQGEAISVSSQNGIFLFTGKNNGSPANLLSAGITAGGNLLVYKTDQLLQP